MLCSSIVGITALAFAGCGGSPSGSSPSGGNTNVTLLATSTANGRFVAYGIEFTSITLTDKAGKTVSLLSQPKGAEFIHLNGISEPLLTASVPRDEYTSAAITFNVAGFRLVYLSPTTGGPAIADYVYSNVMPYPPVVNLPESGLTINGANMVLALNLLVSQSATLAGDSANAAYSITPTFTLSPVNLAAQPTNSSNGRVLDITGPIQSVSQNGFSLTLGDSGGSGVPPIVYHTDSGTVFQGIGGLSSLAAGMSVNLDAQFQPDGSLLATRVYVPNPTAADTMRGMILDAKMVYPPGGFELVGVLEDGEKLDTENLSGMGYGYEGQAAFQISPAYTNLQNLPFPAVFNAASSTAIGQNVSVSSAAMGNYGGGNTTAVTVTLMPQTIDGTVSSISSSDDFEIYTVDLATNDSIVELGGAKGVTIYADSNTQMLNTKPIAVGSVVRFYGLIFNDNGTLRMDCAQINDGVPV
jgi:hypothetical protein